MKNLNLESQFAKQTFSNGYELVDGVSMHRQNPKQFQIPPPVLKRNVAAGYFVELRIDSPRFSVHQDAPEKCLCETCQGETTKPILSHEHPASLLKLPKQDIPSRGWGEDFWAKIVDCAPPFFKGIVDNPLYEARLHQLHQGDEIVFMEDHVLAVHAVHRREMVIGMSEDDLRELVRWLGNQRGA